MAHFSTGATGPISTGINTTGPDCVAVVWDADEPINHAHGASGGGRAVVLRAATAAAGAYANGPEARCSWEYA